MNLQPSVSIIILTKNSSRTLNACLDSIVRSKMKPKEVIIVDGGSTDDTLEIAKKFQVDFILSDEGRGLGYARDIGWRKSSSNYALFVDSDVELNDDFIISAVDAMERDKKLGGLSGKLDSICVGKDIMSLWMTRNLSISLHKLAPVYPEYEKESLHTAATMFRREALIRIGGFDHDMKLALEDWAVCYKLLLSNYYLAYINNFSKHLETPERFRKINIRYGRARVYCKRKGYPIIVFPLRLKFASLCLILPIAILPFASYYFNKHRKLNSEIPSITQLKLGFIEVWRLILRAFGAWLGLINV